MISKQNEILFIEIPKAYNLIPKELLNPDYYSTDFTAYELIFLKDGIGEEFMIYYDNKYKNYGFECWKISIENKEIIREERDGYSKIDISKNHMFNIILNLLHNYLPEDVDFNYRDFILDKGFTDKDEEVLIRNQLSGYRNRLRKLFELRNIDVYSSFEYSNRLYSKKYWFFIKIHKNPQPNTSISYLVSFLEDLNSIKNKSKSKYDEIDLTYFVEFLNKFVR